MTEYNESYNWQRTWLASAPPVRADPAAQRPEPHFQHKRFYDRNESSFNLRDFFSQPSGTDEDPYFLIHGRRDSAIAYPNILHRRSKSAPRQKTPLAVEPEQRPKSDEQPLKEEVTQHHKKHHKKHRPRSPNKRPVERWPELKMEIPNDSPQQVQQAPKKSEYQRAYSPPAAVIYRENKQSPIIHKTSTAREKERITEKMTEYRRQFRRPEIPPQRRAKSATRPIEILHRPLTAYSDPQPEPRRRRRLQSEYQANYIDQTDFAAHLRGPHEEAKQNQQHLEGCHFSRRHFNQLDSATVGMWDPPGSSRSEIVGLDQNLREKRLEEYKAEPAGRRSSPLTEPRESVPRLRLPFRHPAPHFTSTYEPSKYIHQLSRPEPQIKVLPMEKSSDDSNGLKCSPAHHVCDRGGSFLISRPRPLQRDLSPSPVRYTTPFYDPVAYPTCPSPALSCLSRDSMEAHLGLAEDTLERALRRRNKLLISTCRN